ncbi:MAG: oxidoreductase [Betaproteobacteria bacterium]|nr:MAG: oxidoreductase [Betaproteobacteria bacterium]
MSRPVGSADRRWSEDFPETTMAIVGVIGAGVMGGRAAETLAAAGHAVCVFDVVAAAARRLAGAGIAALPSPAEVARTADVVLMYLPGPREVAECVAGAGGLLTTARAGTVVVDQSTVDPETSKRMAAIARATSVGYLDAPVLGRPAMVGKWALVVGGHADDVATCAPVLQALAANVFHIGPSGAGNQVKLLNQLMFGAINAMTAEMMAIAERVGVPPKLLYETITASQAGTVSNLFRELGARIAADDYRDPTFSVDLLVKDVSLAAEMARVHGAPPILARSVEFLNEAARAQGLGSLDTAVMWKCYARFWERSDPVSRAS